MDRRAIGVFDSGLGGLTAVRELRRQLPGETIVYFGDTGRVPYGPRSAAIIERYARQDCRFLLERDVKFIIAACGTVSSVAETALAELPVPSIGVVRPAVAAALVQTKNRRVGVIGTAATIRTGLFRRLLEEAGCTVFAQACPLFVSLAEAGWVDPADDVVRLTAERYLFPLKEQGIDTLILGCTHFPLFVQSIRRVMGDSVTLVDTGREAALCCRERLCAADALAPDGAEGDLHFFVTDRPEGFLPTAALFLGETCLHDIQQVDLDRL